MASDRPFTLDDKSSSVFSMRSANTSSAPYINILSEIPNVQKDEPPIRLFVSGERAIKDRSVSSGVVRFDVGFTGTRAGMTNAQKQQVTTILSIIKHKFPDREWWGRHGDCVGADAEFHALLGKAGFKTHGHPPSNPKLRAHCSFNESDRPDVYRIRNHNIVRESGLLIATPRMEEHDSSQGYSGTWATVRYARQRKKPYVVIMPDGEREGGNGWKRVLYGSQS